RMLRISLTSAAALLAAATALSGCAHQPLMLASQARSAEDPRCALAAERPTASISEWPAEQKGALEQAVRSGAVAVEYRGCGLRVLSQCRVGGRYAWHRMGLAPAAVEIDGEGALYDLLPVSATALQDDLRGAGKLRLVT